MEETEPKEGFKVTDKRRFTTEGQSKSEPEGERPAPRREERTAPEEKTAAEEQPRSESRQPQPPLDFSTFILSLANSTLYHMGLIRTSQDQEPKKDLEAARQTIDLIALLEEKTRGNLDEQEEKIVRETLFQLRMAFVEMTK